MLEVHSNSFCLFHALNALCYRSGAVGLPNFVLREFLPTQVGLDDTADGRQLPHKGDSHLAQRIVKPGRFDYSRWNVEGCAVSCLLCRRRDPKGAAERVTQVDAQCGDGAEGADEHRE